MYNEDLKKSGEFFCFSGHVSVGVLSLLSVTHLRIKLDLISVKGMKTTVIPPAYVTHRLLVFNKN